MYKYASRAKAALHLTDTSASFNRFTSNGIVSKVKVSFLPSNGIL